MTVLNIVLDPEHLRQFADREVVRTQDITISGLPDGMTSGAPSVALFIELPDGRVVFAETSLKLLLTAADALVARFGDPR